VAFIAMGVIGAAGNGGFSVDFKIPGSESGAAQDLLKHRFPARSGDSIMVVFRSDRGVNDPATRQRVESLVGQLSGLPHVVSASTPYDPQARGQVSRDEKVAFANLQLDVQGPSMPVPEVKKMVASARQANGDGVRFALGGAAVQQAEFQNGGGQEGLGILAAMIILLISFGSLLAMGLPILTAVTGIGIGLAIVELLANVVEVPNFAPLVAAMIGIGVGIDYALFVVTRYRQGLHDGMDPEQAVVVAITTAGRAVLFAGLTVVISVMGMLLMNLPFLQGVALGAAAAVLITMIGSLTLLPAMLGFVGRKIDSLRLPFLSRNEGDHRSGFWFRWSRSIQRRPWPFALAGVAAVVLLALPAFSLKLGFPGEETTPKERSSRQAYDLLTEGFGPGFSAPLILAAQLPASGQGLDTLTALQGKLAGVPGVQAVTPPQPNRPQAPDAAVMTVFPTSGGQSDATRALVHRLRNDVLPAELSGTGVRVLVGGPNAGSIDSDKAVAGRLPVFIAVVVGLSFLLLLCVFRSVLVALKAAIMNLLSIGAAYGFLVVVAQWGWMKGLFGIHSTGPIANFIPMMMFAILFGLSMDYEVFLLSRVREEYVRTGDNGLAVADGLATTARVITAAAAIMVMVFLSFVLGPELAIKQIGLGLASAILIDATLIRMVLVPSTMELLGRANWWVPRWLDRMLPRIGFEGEGPATPTAVEEPVLEPVPSGR
jgi:RND superfamily putative drug exporter